jgi:hypothetical protein
VRLALAALLLALLPGATPRPALPDLDQATPFGISVVERHGRLVLVFGSAVDNVGRAPLVVEGVRDGAVMRTWQLVGGARRALPTPLRYVRSQTHRHWHLAGFERYELRRDGALVGRDRKTGFCLNDAYETGAQNRAPRWTSDCARNRPRARVVREGISPGFGDDYVPEKEGQSIDVTGLPSGRYVLVHETNPERAIRESSYSNNAASVALALDGHRVRILARCPDAGTCWRAAVYPRHRLGGDMNKLIALAALAALAVAPAALAKERNVALSGKPAATTAGKSWTATISVTIDRRPSTGRTPTIRLLNNSISSAGRVVNVTTRTTAAPGVYRARLAFPSAGTWRVVVVDRETNRAYSFGLTRVRA